MDFLLIGKILMCGLFAACFIQSGVDKVMDWKGNLEWLTGHFSKTPFAKLVPLLLFKITILELATGFLCLAAMASLVFKGPYWLAPAGVSLGLLTLLLLFTGQRIAKDYPGAATIVSYFGVGLLGLWLLSTT